MSKYTENLIPIMTSNISPKGIASASSAFSDQYGAWRAFSNNNKEYWSTVRQSIYQYPPWLQYDFGEDNKKIIGKYSIETYGDTLTEFPKSWRFEGSNDNINFTVLDIQTNVPMQKLNEVREYEFDNSNYYRIYRLSITQTQSSTVYVYIGKLRMYGLKGKYLIKQNDQYYTTKTEHYDKTTKNFKPLVLSGGDKPNLLDIETFGFDDLSLLTETISEKTINGVNRGILGSGKYFEFKLDNFIKKINSISTPKEFEVTNDVWSNKVPLPWLNGSGTAAFTFNIVEDVYDKLQTKVLNNATITVYFSDGTTFSDTTNYNGKVTILDNIKKINKINISGSHGGGGNFTIQEFNLFKTKNIKYLIYCDNQIYKFNDGIIIPSSSQTLDEDNFTTNGFIDVTTITEEQWNIAFPDKSNLKLLVWTDDMSKTDVSIEIEIIPFRPIDKFNAEFEIKLYK